MKAEMKAETRVGSWVATMAEMLAAHSVWMLAAMTVGRKADGSAVM